MEKLAERKRELIHQILGYDTKLSLCGFANSSKDCVITLDGVFKLTTEKASSDCGKFLEMLYSPIAQEVHKAQKNGGGSKILNI